MIALSLLIALVLDRLVPGLRQWRIGDRLDAYIAWSMRQDFFKSAPPRLLPYLLILPIVFAVWFLGHILRAPLVFELGFNLLVALACLQPGVLNEEVDEEIADLASSGSQADSYLDRLFGRANRALYSVIFWMILVGPVWVVIYRLFEFLTRNDSLPGRQHWLNDLQRMLSWIEWLPALISSYLFMLCGNFEAGTRASRGLPLWQRDIGGLNESRLRNIGMAVLQNATNEEESTLVDDLKHARGMLLRTLVVWLVLAGMIDYWL